MKKENVVRNYSGSDADMTQDSGIMRSQFIDDKEKFVTYDSDFADPFAENWQTSITNAETVAEDKQQVSLLRESTELVEKDHEEARTLYKDMKYYLQKAFPNRESFWVRFGINDYNKARYNVEKMVKLLNTAHDACEANSEAMINAGFKQEKIDRMVSLALDLAQADIKQEKIKNNRPDNTRERIDVLNNCYAFMQKVSKASKRVFADDPLKRDKYLLPGVASEEEPPNEGEEGE